MFNINAGSEGKLLLKSGGFYTDKPIALLIWNTEVENNVHVYLGRIKQDGEYYVFFNDEKGWRISLDSEKFERLKAVTAELKEMFLNADYFFSFLMSGLPDDPERTDLSW